jgi:hypothetical protein
MNITVQKVNGGIRVWEDATYLGKLTYKQAKSLGYALLRMAALGTRGEEKMMKPSYLGDGAYVQPHPEDPTSVILTTGSHRLGEADNRVYLDLEGINSLLEYLVNFKNQLGV